MFRTPGAAVEFELSSLLSTGVMKSGATLEKLFHSIGDCRPV